jgi:uncharacterized protein DUF998
MRPAPLPPPSIPPFARTAALVAAGAGIAFLLILASLQVLRPDLDPTWRVISEYELGPYGWMMQAAFLALALATATLGVAAYAQVRTLGGYLGLILLLVTAIGMVLAGLFETDPLTAPAEVRTPNGRLHELGAMLDSVPLAAPLISYGISRGRRTDVAARGLRYLAWLPLLGTIVFLASLARLLPAHGGAFGPDVLIGIPNRLMIVTHCAWIVLAAGYLLRLPTADHDAQVAA